MVFRRALPADARALSAVRVEFTTSIRPIANVSAFEKATLCYFNEHIGRDDLLAYIAVDGDEIVSSCILCIYEGAPRPSCLCGKSGELLNVYTKAAYRRRGYAKKLLEMLIADARECGVGKITLEYTPDGYALYKALGFTELGEQMALKL